MDTTNRDFFIRKALRLARRGAGWVSPNPMVGAILVKETGLSAKDTTSGSEGLMGR